MNKHISVLIVAFVLSLLVTSCEQSGNLFPGKDNPDQQEPSLEKVIAYDITQAEQPLDITYLSGDRLAVTFLFRNEVRIVDAHDGTTLRTFANVPSPVGITTDARGDLIVTTAPGIFDPNFDPTTDAVNHGVRKIELRTGEATALATLPFDISTSEGTLPRDAVVDSDGRIFVSDLVGGRVFVINPDGATTLWTNDALLRGSAAFPGPDGRPPFLTGINGMRLRDSFLYACNTDFGRLLRFPIKGDGTAGKAEIIVEDEALLGFDEFEFDQNGNIYAILAFRYELLRITPDGNFSIIFGPENGIDNPAGLTKGQGQFKSDLFLTNFSFITNNAGGKAQPGLLVAKNTLR